MQDIKKLIGTLVKSNRKVLHLTQVELACKVGVDPKYISRIETGTSYPSLSVVEKIFKVLNIDATCILGSNENMDKEAMISLINEYLKNTSIKNVKLIKKILESLISEDLR